MDEYLTDRDNILWEDDEKPLFSKEMLNKTKYDYLFKGAFTETTTVIEDKRVPITADLFVNSGRISHFINLHTASHGVNAISVPVHQPDFTNDLDTDYDDFKTIDIKMQNYKFIANTPNYADMMLYKLISEASPTPTLVSPETSVIGLMTTALELLRDSGRSLDNSAALLDTNTYNSLVTETEGYHDGNYWSVKENVGFQFMGVPVIESPCAGTGDIYIINPTDTMAFIKDAPIESGNTIRIGVGTAPDSIVVSADPSAHVVSKHFDESTNDWCVDCWTCGYSSWANTEEEASDKLDKHADKNARIFYRENS